MDQVLLKSTTKKIFDFYNNWDIARNYTMTAVQATKNDSSKLKIKEYCSKLHRLIFKINPIS